MDLVPDIPKGIKEAFENEQLIVFIGAGISRLAGCEGWDSLATRLIQCCFPIYSEAEQILSACLSSKEKISIAYNKAIYTNMEKNFWQAFEQALLINEELNQDNLEIYRLLAQLHTIYVTTNADGMMERENILPSQAWSDRCSRQNLVQAKSPFLFYLHGRYGKGSKEERETLVFTVDSYLRAYADPNRIEFLRELLERKTVLFVGYGLSEFELLDHLFTKGGIDGTGGIRHYILEGFCSYQETLRAAKEKYYQSLGIQLIPYNQDQLGYQQQMIVIQNWILKLTTTSLYNYAAIQNIRASLSIYNQKNMNYLLYYLVDTHPLFPTYLSITLKEIEVAPQGVQWLITMWDKKVIKATDYPAIIPVEKGYRGQGWEFLSCICKLMYKSKSLEFQKFIVEVLKTIVPIAFLEDKYARNWIVLEQVGSIILLLEDRWIKEDFVVFLEKWIHSYQSTAITITLEYSIQWLEWKDTKVKRIFVALYNPTENFHDTESYWLKEAGKVWIPLLKGRKKRMLLEICRENLVSEGSWMGIHEDFKSRFDRFLEDYFTVLEQTVVNIFATMKTKSIECIIEQWIENAHNTVEIQLALYYATKYSLTPQKLIRFSINPLDYTDTWADLYYFLEQAIIHKKHFSEEVIALLDKWISDATFGWEFSKEDKPNLTDWGKQYLISHKIQFYELLKVISEDFSNHCDLLSKELLVARLVLPRERLKNRGLRNGEDIWETVFSDEELKNGTVQELLEKIKQKSFSLGSGLDYYSGVEAYQQIINKANEYGILLELLEHMVELPLLQLDFATQALFKTEFDKVKKLKNLLTVLKTIAQRLYSEPVTEVRERCVRNIIYILEMLNKNKYLPHEFLDFCMTLDGGNLFKQHNPIPDLKDTDIVMEIINCNECRFYILMIESACDQKHDKELINRFEKYISHSLNKDDSMWMLLSVAYEIQNLYCISAELGKRLTPKMFEAQPFFVPHISATICQATSYIVREITLNLVKENRIVYTLQELVGTTSSVQNSRRKIINYLVSAFFFEQIGKEQYQKFITELSPSDYNSLFFSIVQEKNGDLTYGIDAIVYWTYEILEINQDKIKLAEAFMSVARKIQANTVQFWTVINDCVKNATDKYIWWHEMERIWETHTDVYLPEMFEAIICLIDNISPPNLKVVDSALAILLKQGNIQEAKKICNTMLRKNCFTMEMNDWLEELKVNS